MTILSASAPQKRYGVHAAVDGVPFKVQAGEFGLLGPNGASKTTTMWLGDLEDVLFSATGRSLYE